MWAVSDSDILETPVFLSTVTPGKLPTFWLRPVSALKRELFPLLGLPTSAIWRVSFFKPEISSSCKRGHIYDLPRAGAYEVGKGIDGLEHNQFSIFVKR